MNIKGKILNSFLLIPCLNFPPSFFYFSLYKSLNSIHSIIIGLCIIKYNIQQAKNVVPEYKQDKKTTIKITRYQF